MNCWLSRTILLIIEHLARSLPTLPMTLYWISIKKISFEAIKTSSCSRIDSLISFLNDLALMKLRESIQWINLVPFGGVTLMKTFTPGRFLLLPLDISQRGVIIIVFIVKIIRSWYNYSLSPRRRP